ncbi:unnamed protein product [Schistocephalus solidus]|uniref:Reverse transcriptase domain-containing protein n=1 Tax=Schistocephalus solidus TaxID=70667 RepID=A0A3P7CNA4_SCHSO|nr:unnamed protein product [Schistocephalus solidus]
MMAELTTLFQERWRQGQVPQDFKDATIVHLYKRKGNRQLCDNHRGISLLNIAGKIFARILLNRLNGHLEQGLLRESQCGFRRHRGITDMIFAACQLQEKCQEMRTHLNTTFVYLTKAFDTANRNGLWKNMQKFNCPERFPLMEWWYTQGRLRPRQPPAPFPISGLLDSVLTSGSAISRDAVSATNRLICCRLIAESWEVTNTDNGTAAKNTMSPAALTNHNAQQVNILHEAAIENEGPVPDATERTITSSGQSRMSCDPPSEGEVADEIQRLHYNKAPREDGIPIEIYKACVENLDPGFMSPAALDPVPLLMWRSRRVGQLNTWLDTVRQDTETVLGPTVFGVCRWRKE